MEKELKIGIFTTWLTSWNGGVDFLRHQLNALSEIAEKESVKIYIFSPKRPNPFLYKLSLLIKILCKTLIGKDSKKSIEKLKSVHFDIVKQFSYLKNHHQIHFISYRKNKDLAVTITKEKINVTFFGDKEIANIPNIFYYPDFQHKHLTEFFSAEEIANRDASLLNLLKIPRTILLNSQNAQDDLKKFFSDSCKECEIISLPYSPMILQNEWLEDLKEKSGIDVIEKYNLPKRYFLISNQFWIHKSHITAFEALSFLTKDQNFSDVMIICTGLQQDYRFVDYFKNLVEKTKNLGVDNKISYLGLIPKREQIEIMKKSIAIIQPTLFEGDPGGGSYYDAVSIGVPAIISDIAVNLEAQGEKNTLFFKTKDSQDLKEKMQLALTTKFEKFSKEQLLEKSKMRAKKHGLALLKIAKLCQNINLYSKPAKDF